MAPLRCALAVCVLVGVSACGKSGDPPAVEKEPLPTATASVSGPELAPRFPWSTFPKRLSYTAHYRGGKKLDLPTVEIAERRETADGEIVTITFEQTEADGPTIRSVSTHLLNHAGLHTTAEVDMSPGQDPQERRYDPPRLDVPAKPIPGTEWTIPRYDGTTKRMTTESSSPFCRDGFRIIIHATPKIGGAQRMIQHWCPGTGWRGQDSVTTLEDGSRIWMWTTGLTADGTPLPDPPLGDRFSELPPAD